MQKNLSKVIGDKYKYYSFKNKKYQHNNQKNTDNINYSPVTPIVAPQLTVYQQKIRQAIQGRYRKSKIKDFKYEKISSQNLTDNNIQRISESQNSEDKNSQQMEQMKHYLYLKNHQYVNIYEFIREKQKIKLEEGQIKERIRKRRLQTNASNYKEKEQVDHHSFSSLQNKRQPKQVILNEQGSEKFVLKFNKNQSAQLEIQQQSQLEQKIQKKIEQKIRQEKKRSFTSRFQIRNNISNYEMSGLQKHQTLTPNSNMMIKDTFKLKKPSEMLLNQLKLRQQYLHGEVQLKKKQQTTGRSIKRKMRRYLLRNSNLEKQNKTQNSEGQFQQKNENQLRKMKIDSLKKFQNVSSKNIESKNITSNKQIEKNVFKSAKHMLHNRSDLFINNFQQKSEKDVHSLSENKWKLQEISFRFKPINQASLELEKSQMDAFIGNQKKCVKLGISLQKAYQKLVYENKVKKQQKSSANNRKTINPKRRQSIIDLTTIQTAVYRQQLEKPRSISKNQRRKLRIKTQTDESDILIKTFKKGNTDSSELNLPSRLNNLSNKASSKSKYQQISRKRQILSNFRKKQIKNNKFATID